MNKHINAIETCYQGYRFRSRLEARWAIFFDSLGIKWEYEIEGFILTNGRKYLPDFYLPKFCEGLWVEVKPVGGDFSVAKRFAKENKCSILLAEGTPDLVVYGFYDGKQDEDGSFGEEARDGDACFDDKYLPGGRNADEHRMFYWTGLNPMDDVWNKSDYDGSSLIFRAVTAARSARFEHGETPRFGNAA
jgi:hypothetical protein